MEKNNQIFSTITMQAYNEAKTIIKRINELKKCPNCGAPYVEDTCKYCHHKNDELTKLINKLAILIRIVDTQIEPLNAFHINDFFNLLINIDGIKINNVESFLTKYNYYQLYNDFFTQFAQKLNKPNTMTTDLTPLELNLIESFIINQKSSQELIPFYKYIIGRAIHKKNNISYEAFEDLIILFTKTIMKNITNNPICKISDKYKEEDIQEKELGSSLYNEITIDRFGIKDLYYKGETDVINTIFHELTHTLQYYKVFSGSLFDENILIEIMDHELSNHLRGYYKENYDNISYEIEARYYGLLYETQFLQSLGIKINNDIIKEHLITLECQMKNTKRYSNNKLYEISNMFYQTISYKPELLKRHPQLFVLYRIDNDHVIKKTPEEMQKDYLRIVNGDFPQEAKSKYLDFYSKILDTNNKNHTL